MDLKKKSDCIVDKILKARKWGISLEFDSKKLKHSCFILDVDHDRYNMLYIECLFDESTFKIFSKMNGKEIIRCGNFDILLRYLNDILWKGSI